MIKFVPILAVSFMVAPAMAADYLVAPIVPETSPWSRAYIGASGGVGSGKITFESSAIPGEVSSSVGGLEAGIRAGYDYAQDSFLAGIVADYAITNVGIKGDVTIPGVGSTDVDYRLSGLATLRARAGVIQHNNLFYIHAGGAAASVYAQAGGSDIPGLVDNPRLGFVGGFGHEYAVAEHVTVQTEYSYVHLGKFDAFSDAGTTVSDQLSFHKISTGVNFRF